MIRVNTFELKSCFDCELTNTCLKDVCIRENRCPICYNWAKCLYVGKKDYCVKFKILKK